MKLEGYAVIFDTPTQIGDFTETILREALNDTDISDVALFYNHDTRQIPLARTPNTLTLQTDQRGLKFSAVLPDTQEGKAVYESVKRGDLRGCSFAFRIADNGESWQGNQRTIRAIEKIFECSICPYPAYSDTTVEARNKQGQIQSQEEKKGGGFKMANTNTNTNFTFTTNNQGQEQQENQLGGNAQTLLRNVAGLETLPNKTFDRESVLETAEYRSAFYKQLQGKQLTLTEKAALTVAREDFEKRANEFNTSTNTAAMIPTQTLNEIITKARTQGGLLEECRAFSVPSGVAIPVATPSQKANWHTEGAAVDSEKIDTDTSVTFSGNEILKVFSMSLKTQTMAISAFESYLTDELENCIMDTINYSLLYGTGEGQGTGLMSVFDSDNTITSGIQSDTTEIDYDSVIKMIAHLKRGYANGAKFAMNNRTLWQVFYGMRDYDGRPLFIQDLQNDGIGKILGFPIVIDDNIADHVVIFGNFKYMAYNLPSGIVIESSRESSFKSGLIDYRAICIADTKPLLKEAFVLLRSTL